MKTSSKAAVQDIYLHKYDDASKTYVCVKELAIQINGNYQTSTQNVHKEKLDVPSYNYGTQVYEMYSLNKDNSRFLKRIVEDKKTTVKENEVQIANLKREILNLQRSEFLKK